MGKRPHEDAYIWISIAYILFIRNLPLSKKLKIFFKLSRIA